MCDAVIGGFALFFLSLAIHVIVWRVRRPESFRAWVPALAVIFGVVPAAIAWLVAPTMLDFAALLLLQGSLSVVYGIGYTLVSAFSPSVELLKLLDRAPDGVPMAALQLPFVAGGLTTERIENLAASGFVRQTGQRLDLCPRGAWLTRLVLIYRHAIGLPDSGGG
jgi:hypothetical protein